MKERIGGRRIKKMRIGLGMRMILNELPFVKEFGKRESGDKGKNREE